MGRVKRKSKLSKKELTQLTVWGGVLLVVLLALVYGLVRAGAVIPVGNGATSHTAGAIQKNTAASHP